MPLTPQELAGLIDSYAGPIILGPEKRKIDSGTEEWIAGKVHELEHADNGAGSELHPLTCLHFTTGAAPHYTLQAGWIQSLCLKQLGVISNTGLTIIASGCCTATTKQEVKAAQQAAYGHNIQSIDNLHFYPGGGEVGVTAPNLQTALALVQQAMNAVGPIGVEMNAKDDAYLAGIPVLKAALAGYGLKATEAPAWGRLEKLLNWVIPGVLVSDHALRKQRAHIVYDALTRMSS